MPTGYDANVCLRRLVEAGRIRRIRAGLYVVRDPAGETQPIAVASGVFAEVPHDVTTDAALAYHGRSIVRSPLVRHRPNYTLRPVTLDETRIGAADAYETTVEGFGIRIGVPRAGVVDARAEPRVSSLRRSPARDPRGLL